MNNRFAQALFTGCFILLLPVLSSFGQIGAAAPGQGSENAFHSFESQKKQLSQEWSSLEREQDRQWKQLREDISRKWHRVVVSSRRLWVDYDADMESRSIVDFKEGQIEIEAIVSTKAVNELKKMAEKVEAALKKIFQRSDLDNQPVMQNQVENQHGKTVDKINLNVFIQKEVLPQIKADPSPYQSQDGQVRRRYTVKIPMVKGHLQIRLKKYLPLIDANANKFDLPPELLAAVIHTESYFNPLAISHAGAIGLMQVIPKYAGRESYRYLYGQDWTIRPEYLQAPGINVELGSAYLHLLSRQYFADIKDPTVNRYVSICAYNWGPTAVRRNLIDRHDFRNMLPTEAMRLLRQKSPDETSKYLAKVVERMELYAGSFK